MGITQTVFILLVTSKLCIQVKDFLYFGTPLQLVLWILTVVLLTTNQVWYISWIATTLVLVVVTIARTSTFFSDLVSRKKSDKAQTEQ
mmetsp:Transcript_15292/g.27715  ORF Transcript_15292/g.27715 Transcript_15292/m.27715 type:complete len:88 (+) Transcript_15292:304-567(+)